MCKTYDFEVFGGNLVCGLDQVPERFWSGPSNIEGSVVTLPPGRYRVLPPGEGGISHDVELVGQFTTEKT